MATGFSRHSQERSTGLAPPAPQPDCRQTRRPAAGGPSCQGGSAQGRLWGPGGEQEVLGVIAVGNCFGQGSRASRSPRPGGAWVHLRGRKEQCELSSLPRIDYTQRVSISARNDFRFYPDDEGSFIT
jgi:hypothetical protein